MDPKPARRIAEALAEEIRRGVLAPGTSLQQEALASRFKVSRQPVRMALQALQAEGLLDARSDRTLAVAGIDPQRLRDLAATRLIVEREALRLAMASRGPKDVLAATHIQERIEIEPEPRTIEELDKAFHTALYAPCGNARLVTLIAELRSEHRGPYGDQAPGSPKRARWARDHRRILKAYAAGDAAKAIAALEDHLTYVEGR